MRVCAVVLASGRGTRFQHPAGRSKLLMPVQGKPLIRYVVDALYPVVDNLIVVVGYDGDAVQRVLPKRGITVVWNDRFHDYDQIYAFTMTEPWIPDGVDLIVADGDLVVHPDTVRCLVKSKGSMIPYDEQPPTMRDMGLTIRDDLAYRLAYGRGQGTWISMTRLAGSDVQSFQNYCVPDCYGYRQSDILNILFHTARIPVLPIHRSWVNVNTQQDLAAAQRVIEEWRTKTVRKNPSLSNRKTVY